MRRTILLLTLAAGAVLAACSDRAASPAGPDAGTVAAAVPGGPITGAIFTTNVACSGVDLNIYAAKGDVYLDGGPAHPHAASLPAGSYFVQVTDPSGGTVLGTSLGTTHPQPFVVDASGVATCLRLSAILRNPADNSAGYADTPSPGGEYKVWVSLDSAFANNLTKTDNFKVNAATPPDVHTWLRARKFYDANANGINDDGQLIEGWRMTITDGITAVRFTPVNMEVAPDTYTVTEGTPVQTNWMRTTANPLVVGLAAGMDTTVAFGNLCLGPGGGLTLGFWSNKNGQATIVAGDFTGAGATYGLNAQPFFANTWFAAGTGFGATLTTQKSNLRSWLLNGNAVDMRYMLSVQAAAMMLNVNHGFVSATALVYAPGVPSASPLGFTTVGALLTDARNALGGTDRPLQEAIKTAIDRANNNLTFVQPTPCAFSF